MNNKKSWSFCETPEENCTMNYCDNNGCQNRKRNYVKGVKPSEQDNSKYESMKTFKTKQNLLVKIENPFNILFLKELMQKNYIPSCIKNHPDGFDFAHGITNEEELKKEIEEGSDIYLKEKEIDRFSFQVGLLTDKLESFRNYNKIT